MRRICCLFSPSDHQEFVIFTAVAVLQKKPTRRGSGALKLRTRGDSVLVNQRVNLVRVVNYHFIYPERQPTSFPACGFTRRVEGGLFFVRQVCSGSHLPILGRVLSSRVNTV